MMTPMKLIRLSVPSVSSSASTTPISDSGSESITGSGAVNEPNCITSTRYMSAMPMTSAMPISLKTSCWSREAPPSVEAVARREVDRLRDLQRVGRDLAGGAALRVGRHGDRALAVQVLDLRRALAHA